MPSTTLGVISAGLFAALSFGCAMMDRAAPQPAAQSADRSAVNKMLEGWPPRPQLAVQQMMAKYGAPQEATPHTMVWREAGPYKRIMVTRVEIPHDFPKPHMDFLEHTIAYKVPPEKTVALVMFDGSVTVNRTAGEMSARCDLEGHNILTLNLAHDIVTGKKTVAEARQAFAQNVVDDTLGKNPPYVTTLQFDPASNAGPFADTPNIPGSPRRAGDAAAGASKAAPGSDAEVLGFVTAINENEVLAAMDASKKKVSQPVLGYAKMLHMAHGKSVEDTLKLGQKIGVTPAETAAVDQLRQKGAKELAAIVPLNGEEFGRAYLAMMVKGHAEVLGMIDGQLMKSAQSEEIKKHLGEQRKHVAMHLEQAKKVQAGLKR